MNRILDPAPFWRSLDEPYSGADDAKPALQPTVSRERREFLKSLAAASAALAGVAGCARRPFEAIVPYAHGPQQADYGKPLFYATAFLRGGYAAGVLVESNMGRPTKIEGNPVHPASLGATDIFAQASIRDLWDPDRSQTVMRDGAISTWQTLLGSMAMQMRALDETQGAGLHVLTETVTSPTLAAQLRMLLDRYPRARWHQYQPLNRDQVYAGTRLAFGTELEPQYRLERAAVIVSLDADFLDSMPGAVRYARDFAAARRAAVPAAMSRLHAVESTPRITGAVADHRIAMRAGDVDAFARSLAQRLGVPGLVAHSAITPGAWIDAVVRDLQTQRGRSNGYH